MMSSPTSSSPRAARMGPSVRGDLAVARAQRLRHALAAHGQVAADLAALRNARQRRTAPARRRSRARACRPARSRAGTSAPSASVAPPWFSVSMMLPRFRPSGPTRKMPMPPMPSSGFRMMSRCSAWKRFTSAASRVTSVGPMNCGNSRIASFSGWSRSARGLVEDPGAFAFGLLQQVRGVEVLAVEGRVLAHQHRMHVRSAAAGVRRAPAARRGTSRARRR